MSVTLTRNLKLRVDSNLTSSAKYNLQQIDTLGSTFLVDTKNTLNVRSLSDIIIQPNSADIGGSGAGGTVTIGSQSQPVVLTLNTAQLNLINPGLLDQAASGTKYLRLQYNSALDGSVDTASDRILSIDTDGGDRELVLGGSLSLLGGDAILNASGATSLTLPVIGTLATLAGTETFTNKIISAAQNTITGLTDSAIGNAAAIAYSKLNLTSSILNSDVSPSAAISYSKLSLSGSIVDTDIATAAGITRSKLAIDTTGVVINDNSGVMTSETFLARSRGGSGQDNSALTFPSSGTLLSNSNTATVIGKTLSGSFNTFSNIPYSALGLSGHITNGDVASSAAIAYSKLNLTASIVDGDVSPSAAISYNKLDLSNSIFNSDISTSAAIAYSKLNLSTSIQNSDVATNAAIAGTKISPDFGNQYVRTLAGINFEEGGFKTFLEAAQSGQTQDITFTLPSLPGTTGQLLSSDGSGNMTWITATGTGTVTSVALGAPAEFIVGGSPITTSGTLTLVKATQSANTFWAGPTSGAAAQPTFRALAQADLPAGLINAVLDSTTIHLDDTSNTLTANVIAGSLTNTQISSSAAIAFSKMAALTASRALTSNSSGVVAVSSTTDVELSYLSGTTSSVQTQLNGKEPTQTHGNISTTTTGVTISNGSAATVGPNTTVNIATASSSLTGLLTSTDWTTFNSKASPALSNLTVSGLTAQDLLVASSSSAVSRLGIGSNGQILTVVAGAPAWAPSSSASFNADWITSDGTTKTVTHNLGTTDVIIQLYDKTDGATIGVDSILRTDANTAVLTSSVAPGAAGWRVMIIKA